MNPAPPKPPINANRKALAAYFSELRRWAIALQHWEADLDQRESELDRILANGEEDEECDCTDVKESPIIGDEIQWLEKLLALPDKRRK